MAGRQRRPAGRSFGRLLRLSDCAVLTLNCAQNITDQLVELFPERYPVQALKSRVPVITLALIALPIVLAVDAGAVTLTKLAVPDDADEAGRAGVQAIMFNGVATPEEAQLAFTAAKSVSDTHHEHIDPA